MTIRDIIKGVLDGHKPLYTSWSFKFTVEEKKMLTEHFNTDDPDDVLHNHILMLGADIGFFDKIGEDLYRDVSGAAEDRSKDKEIGFSLYEGSWTLRRIENLLMEYPYRKLFLTEYPNNLV